ncbi:MAG TPA: hypothetical protein VFI31_06990 [Pirellulales bacterium]|nr:hypothetical protein [Pirellulales bacterium]
MNNIRIEFGTLHDVLGKAVAWDGLSIIPAMVELNGQSFSTGFELRDAVGQHPPAVLARLIEQHYDAAWVRGRLPRVFGFTPEIAEVEKSLLDVGFVAVAFGGSVGFPFICADYYGRTGLMFSPEGPEEKSQACSGRCSLRHLTTSKTSRRPFIILARVSGCTSAAPTASRIIESRMTKVADQRRQLAVVGGAAHMVSAPAEFTSAERMIDRQKRPAKIIPFPSGHWPPRCGGQCPEGAQWNEKGYGPRSRSGVQSPPHRHKAGWWRY